MNNTIKELFDRKSVRAFTDREITDEERELILMSAAMAPTAGNMQMYTIIDVRDPEKKLALSKSCDNQPFIANAKMVLVFCADYVKWYDAFKDCGCEPRHLGMGDLLLAVSDTCIAAQNTVTAAWSLGIGSCYIGDIIENCETQRDILGLPEGVVPVCMAVFGYPTQQQAERDKPERAPLDKIVSVDTYPAMDAEYRRALFEYKSGKMTYEEWMKAMCSRKYNSDFSVEMTRSAEKYAEYFLPGLDKK